jgi:hypothetical protein
MSAPDLDPFARLKDTLAHDWKSQARPEQLPPPGDWSTWLVLAGRGFGKTRTGSEFIRSLAEAGTVSHIALVAATAADGRDVMIEGPAGLLSIAPNSCRPVFEPASVASYGRTGCKQHSLPARSHARSSRPNKKPRSFRSGARWRSTDRKSIRSNG